MCIRCYFRNNRVTGNGGAIFIEPPQPGRVIVDPDIDVYTDDEIYSDRIDLQNAGIPLMTEFVCSNCVFKNNLAMSIARGYESLFGTLPGGFGGAIFIGTGLRFKRLLDMTSLNKMARISRAYGCHGSINARIINGSKFVHNHGWWSGGAINVVGGRTTAKNSILHFTVKNAEFNENSVMQGVGGAIKLIKVAIMEITNATS